MPDSSGRWTSRLSFKSPSYCSVGVGVKEADLAKQGVTVLVPSRPVRSTERIAMTRLAAVWYGARGSSTPKPIRKPLWVLWCVQFLVLALCQLHQILRPVIGRIVVDVVDNLTGEYGVVGVGLHPYHVIPEDAGSSSPHMALFHWNKAVVSPGSFIESHTALVKRVILAARCVYRKAGIPLLAKAWVLVGAYNPTPRSPLLVGELIPAIRTNTRISHG